MTFHEKSAWISLVAIVLVGGFYFLHVPWTLTPSPDRHLAVGFLYCILAFLVIEVVGHVVVAVRAPKEAHAPRDERERLINLKAIRMAAYVYVIGSFLAVYTLHWGANRLAIANGVLLAFVIAEVVNYGARRGV
jgi:hypothetical protein